MNDFAIVAIVLALFLGFGIAMGVLIVSASSGRRPYLYLGDGERHRPPGEEDTTPRWPGA